jgi:4-hydroxy-2-oxoglutarate aldolase
VDPSDTAVRLSGIFAPITTPFLPDESLDQAGLEVNLERYAASELRGYLVLGSNGENRSLTETERLRVLDIVVGSKAEGQTVMAGAMYAAQRDTERFLETAAAAGADFGLILPPDYFRKQMTDEVLLAYFRSLADRSPLPFLLYHAPQFCAVGVSPWLATELADLPRVVGLKWSASTGIETVLPLERPGFHVLAGSANFLLEAIEGGSPGGTVSLANYLPDLAVDLHRAAAAGRAEEARRLQEQVGRINRAVSGIHGVAGVKAAMDLLGFVGGIPRRPLRTLDPGERDELLRAIEVEGVQV